MKKKVVAISDPHCGHLVGLTPPKWQKSIKTKWGLIQYQLWNAYIEMLERQKPVDILFVVGDCIDGKGSRSGGTEQITTDRNEQVEMAVRVIREIQAEAIVMVYGTPYHSGMDEDWERQIADKVQAKKLGSHEWPEVNGLVFDVKHKIGSSSIPHGRATPIERDRLWNFLWTEHEEQPKADILIRGHVHYFHFCGEDSWLGITLPALQGLGSKFGARQCSGHVDFGLVYFDVEEDGTYSWGWDIARVASQKATTIKL